MTDHGFKYGFRYDPMEFAMGSDSLQAALVRRVVLKQPKTGDDATIEAHFQEIFAKQHPDGAIDHVWLEGREDTATMVRHLLEMGCPADRPELARAASVIRDRAISDFVRTTFALKFAAQTSRSAGDAGVLCNTLRRPCKRSR